MSKLKQLVVPGMVSLGALAGVVGGSALTNIAAHADTTSSATTSTSTAAQTPMSQQFDPSKGGHTANGITEEVLTGDTATKAKAAAETAEPGATVIRAETDAEGATYEVHMQKSDGTYVTVYLDASFKVTSTDNGFGGPGRGDGDRDASSSSNTN